MIMTKSNRCRVQYGIRCRGIMYKKQRGRNSEALRDAGHRLGGKCFVGVINVEAHQT